MDHLEVNLGATGWILDETHMARLTQVSEPAPPYPYSFIGNARGDR
jgi:hypothetical protein